MHPQVLTKFNLADVYKGQEEATGEDFNVEEVEDGPRPFTCLLDSGLKRTSTGSKVFAALKASSGFKRAGLALLLFPPSLHSVMGFCI